VDATGLSALLTPQGWALLEALPPYDEQRALALGQRLRDDGVEPALVAAALTQSRLRARARAKFGPFADGMLFTAEGLEQATRLEVAARHAQRFTSAGVRRVADLGCGIGGDAMALAGLDVEVLAVERDETTASVATVNLRHWPQAVVRHEDAMSTDLAGVGGAFLDPARRTASGRRVLDPRQAQPPLSFVTDLAARLPAVGAKVAPGIGHQLVPADAEAQWVSVDGDVVEAGLWFGLLAREGVRRSALVLTTGPDGGAVTVDDTGLQQADAGAVGGYLYEPDGAVIRARLIGDLARANGAWMLSEGIAYLTADREVDTPFARGFRVIERLPADERHLRQALHSRGVGTLEIKKRGVDVDPAALRTRLKLKGDGSATVVLTREEGRHVALLVERL
jgi:hypothetical protein